MPLCECVCVPACLLHGCLHACICTFPCVFLAHLSRTTSEGDNLGLPTNFKYQILPIKILRARSRGFEGGYRTGIEGHDGVYWDSSPVLESFPSGVQSDRVKKEERAVNAGRG